MKTVTLTAEELEACIGRIDDILRAAHAKGYVNFGTIASRERLKSPDGLGRFGKGDYKVTIRAKKATPPTS